MTKRKSISKKVRFEVFKRDSFKCQYCGKTSPDVVLEVDHIKPVAEGGSNDITNLITACFDCNRGKSKTLLDDKSVLDKQRQQLEELNERRNQLQMMMEWREGLLSIEEDKVKIFCDKWTEHTNYNLTESGKTKLRKWLKKYDFALFLDCLEISVNQYLQTDRKGGYTQESVDKAFNYIPRIAQNKVKGEQQAFMKDLFYIRGIMRNRFHYVNDQKAIKYLKEAYENDVSIESLKDLVLSCKNWTEFTFAIEEYLDD